VTAAVRPAAVGVDPAHVQPTVTNWTSHGSRQLTVSERPPSPVASPEQSMVYSTCPWLVIITKCLANAWRPIWWPPGPVMSNRRLSRN